MKNLNQKALLIFEFFLLALLGTKKPGFTRGANVVEKS